MVLVKLFPPRRASRIRSWLDGRLLADASVVAIGARERADSGPGNDVCIERIGHERTARRTGSQL